MKQTSVNSFSELKGEIKSKLKNSIVLLEDLSYLNERIIYCYDKSGHNMGAIFQGEDGFLEWRKQGFEPLLLSLEELVYFFQKISESRFLRGIILCNEETKIIIPKDHKRKCVEDLFKMNILEKFIHIGDYVGYQFKRYA